MKLTQNVNREYEEEQERIREEERLDIEEDVFEENV